MGTEPAICRAGSRRPRGRARAEALGARSECPTTGIAASTGTSPFETPRPARLSRRRNRAAAPRWSKTNTQPDRLTDLVDAVAPSADVPTCRPPAADRRGQTMSVATAPSALWLSCHTQEEIAAELDMAQRTVTAVSVLQRDAVQCVEAPHRGDRRGRRRRSASARYVIARVGQPRYPLTAAARGDRAQSWHAVASCTTASQRAGLDGTIRRRLMRPHAATPSWTVSRSVAIKCCRS